MRGTLPQTNPKTRKIRIFNKLNKLPACRQDWLIAQEETRARLAGLRTLSQRTSAG